MTKKRTSFAISEEVINMLKKLADSNNRSQANMLEQLIKDAFEKEGVK